MFYKPKGHAANGGQDQDSMINPDAAQPSCSRDSRSLLQVAPAPVSGDCGPQAVRGPDSAQLPLSLRIRGAAQDLKF